MDGLLVVHGRCTFFVLAALPGVIAVLRFFTSQSPRLRGDHCTGSELRRESKLISAVGRGEGESLYGSQAH